MFVNKYFDTATFSIKNYIQKHVANNWENLESYHIYDFRRIYLLLLLIGLYLVNNLQLADK